MHLELEFAVRLIEIMGKIATTWPSDPNAKPLKKIVVELLWIFSVLNSTVLLAVSVAVICNNRDDATFIMQCLSESADTIECLFNLIFCKLYNNQFYDLLSEYLNYLASAKDDEKQILCKNTNRHFVFWSFYCIWYFQGILVFAFSAFMMNKLLPVSGWYPFDVKASNFVYCLVYSHQILSCIQGMGSLAANFVICLLLCYLSTKLEILSLKLETVASVEELNECIQKHQYYIGFFERLANSSRYIILKSLATTSLCAIFGAFPIIMHPSIIVKLQFVMMVIAGTVRLYITVPSADYVTEMSKNVALAVYNSPWFNESLKMQKSTIIIFMIRSQKPLTLSIPGILSALTLEYYASFLSTTLSYFMALRAALIE